MGIETAPAMKGSTMTSLKFMFATGAIVGALAGQVTAQDAACPQDGHKASLGASGKKSSKRFSTSFAMPVIRWRKKLC
ncbi:hypothetical protein [Ensifer sp. ENS12]|uniref:hypothetical protein n=1 Tax=Ensifer sp. ENS12 TaxID=2854774 RepID=UPI001C45129C|nr:hypothetical protein [Ensifer sp. ENS12]MBV7520488.1 hypothetical protein [Ensifer sp. ENS12]